MKFGLTMFLTDEGIRPAALGRALEERGFESVFVPEHSHIPLAQSSGVPGDYSRSLDLFVSLTELASATTTLVLGTGVMLLAQRDVIHTAKQVASVDLVSDGRFLMGIGVGWHHQEMANHGVNPHTRGRLMDEQILALKQIWTNDAAEFHGTHIDFEPILAWPKPVQRPHPPIYIAGESEAALRRLVRHGDGWLPRDGLTSPQQIIEIRTWLAAHGRTGVPVSIFGADVDPRTLDGYVEAGAERAIFRLDAAPESMILHSLDTLAAVIERYQQP